MINNKCFNIKMTVLVHGWVFWVIWASWANWVIWAIWGNLVIWAIWASWDNYWPIDFAPQPQTAKIQPLTDAPVLSSFLPAFPAFKGSFCNMHRTKLWTLKLPLFCVYIMDWQSNVTLTAELESQLGQIRIPIYEVLPQCLRQWLTAFAYSNGTTSGCCFVLRWYPRALCWLMQHWSFLAHTRRKTFTLLLLLLLERENTSMPVRLHRANHGPCRRQNKSEHRNRWNIVKWPVQPFIGSLVSF